MNVEQLLQVSTEEFFEHAPCGYLLTRPDGGIVRVNATFEAWTGHGREALLAGRRLQDLLTVPGKIFYETHYAPLLAMQGFVHEIALDLVCADRRSLPVLVNSVQARQADGAPLLVRTTIFNATERRRYERELLLARDRAEQAARARADLLAMIGHDIRTPLSSLATVGELLDRTAASPEQRRYIAILRSSVAQMLGLTSDILDLTRIEAGAIGLSEAPFDLGALVTARLQPFLPVAEAKRLDLAAELDPELPARVVGDALKIGQVLTNLLGNAIKFTPAGSVRVAVRVRERPPGAVTVEFSVADTGIGIAADRLEHVFDEFTQASEEIERTYGGTGLGLAIGRKLLALYGSKMTVQSAPGQGTTFAFALTLPVAPDDAPAAGPAP